MNRFLLLNLHTFFIWSSFSFKREVGYVDVKDLPGRITFTRNRFLLFFLLLFSLPSFSQSLAGKIQDTEGKPLPFANLLLLNGKDSSLVKGVASDAGGSFLIEKVRPGTYVLSGSAIGFKTGYSSRITIGAASGLVKVPVFSLVTQSKQLKEVTVTGIRPFVELRPDRTIVNIANSIIASGSTALEVLEKAPGVTVDRQNDQLYLKGKEGVIVQIDGKQTYLSMADVVALLRSMPSDNIDRIELITNPSAKYDAAGNSGIIDIKLKKNNNIGTNGSLSVAAGSGRFDRQRGSLQINHRTAKLNFFGSYSANRGGNYWDFKLERDQVDGSERNLVDQDSYIKFKERGQNAKAGIDYFINKTTTIGLVYTAFWSNTQERSPAGTSFRRKESDPVYLQTLTEKKLSNIPSNQLGNLNIQHMFGKKGGQLTADVNMGYFERKFTNSLITQTLIPSVPSEPLSGLFTQMPTTIKIFTARADYSQSINSIWKMEAGVKTGSVLSDNNLTLNSGDVGNLQPDLALSNHFRYTERVNAVYVSFSGKLDLKTEIQFGVRAEHTHSVGNSITFNNVVKRNYLNLFPSVFLSRPLSKNHTLVASYSYRIDRPNYPRLNPARSYLDPYAYSSGNPYLNPQYTHSLELKHGFKNKIYTSLGASFVHDYVFFVIKPVGTKSSERIPENIGKSQVYNLTLSFPATVIKGWTLQTTIMGTYSQFQYTYKGTPLSVQQVSGRLNGSNAITLGKGWTAELTGWLNTPSVNALWHSPWLGSLDVGIQKSIRSNLKAKFTLQDVFHSNQILGKIEAPNFYSNINIKFDTRVAMLTLIYNFGNQQLKSSRQRKAGAEEEVQRTN
ncbi:MAG: TonB-dependent receptor [Chitinophagaceae bacterium]